MPSGQTQTDLSARPSPGATPSSGLSGPMLAPLGDDLTRSRLFALKAGAEMAAIVEAERDPHDATDPTRLKGRDPVWLSERLGTIQREAKRARARAVYRSAQDALSLIQRCNVHMPIDWTRVDGRLFTLNKLLTQYEAGLEELERDTPVLLAPRVPDPADATALPFDPVHEIARTTLTCLLPHASAAERDALTRLMDADLAPPAREGADEMEPTDAPELKTDRIEWIMPDLVQSLLETGREYGKIFSVSHALDDVVVVAGAAALVRDRLYDTLSGLVMSSLPLQGLGRIDITEAGDALRVSGSGFEPVLIALPERVKADVAVAEDRPRPIDAPAPRITPDTEADLRAQLSALMDGGLVDGGLETFGRDDTP
ncbi:MAG: hypothetical protein WBG08_02960 [Litorimonas sp.]